MKFFPSAASCDACSKDARVVSSEISEILPAKLSTNSPTAAFSNLMLRPAICSLALSLKVVGSIVTSSPPMLTVIWVPERYADAI